MAGPPGTVGPLRGSAASVASPAPAPAHSAAFRIRVATPAARWSSRALFTGPTAGPPRTNSRREPHSTWWPDIMAACQSVVGSSVVVRGSLWC